MLAHSKKPRPSTTMPSMFEGPHFPCTFSPLANVCKMNSLGSS